ncbi:hypothetical protein BX589_12020 [Paraburkholderia fungorum]|jgi:hypothetical protein|uniref:hypothetical protein n=1 Tax=Paraburkholderia fungorum TaxID=134537 RepID=UPI000D05A1D6|nr:hypothetical protein [Paraburkholderia fungorum]PRZ51179.1 hypothetical protein BX589_12020 [Paraburkholderia fungorum]
MTEADEKRVATLAMKVLQGDEIAALPGELKTYFLSQMMLVAFELLRMVEGDEFVRGWLDEATASLNDPLVFGSSTTARGTH